MLEYAKASDLIFSDASVSDTQKEKNSNNTNFMIEECRLIETTEKSRLWSLFRFIQCKWTLRES